MPGCFNRATSKSEDQQRHLGGLAAQLGGLSGSLQPGQGLHRLRRGLQGRVHLQGRLPLHVVPQGGPEQHWNLVWIGLLHQQPQDDSSGLIAAYVTADTSIGNYEM